MDQKTKHLLSQDLDIFQEIIEKIRLLEQDEDLLAETEYHQQTSIEPE